MWLWVSRDVCCATSDSLVQGPVCFLCFKQEVRHRSDLLWSCMNNTPSSMIIIYLSPNLVLHSRITMTLVYPRSFWHSLCFVTLVRTNFRYASNISKHNQHNALYELQHGFREKRSCETQLIQLVEDLGRQLTFGKQTDLVFLDLSKAFDKVNHLKLLYKLACFGIKGNTLKWIQSFLIGRTQTVVLDGESSD